MKTKVTVEVKTVHGPADELGYVQNFYADGPRVYAAGGGWRALLNQSLLLRSTDDGATFTQLSPPVDSGLRAVFADGDQIWVVGDSNCIAKSDDAGEKWKQLRKNKPDDYGTTLYTITRDEDGTFWVCGDGGVLLKSTDGGTKFRKVKVPTTARLLRLYADPGQPKKRPWLVGADGVYRWKEKGTGFDEVTIKKKGNKTIPTMCDIVRTTTGTIILVGDGGSIFRSEDDGKTWHRAVNPAGSTIDLEAVIVTTFGILVVGDKATLLASNDDGRTFVSIETDPKMEGHVWSVIASGDGLLIGSDSAGIYRLSTSDLAKIVIAAFKDTDKVLASLAEQIRDGTDEDARLILEDALRERSLL